VDTQPGEGTVFRILLPTGRTDVFNSEETVGPR
jgi:hypothetical protein